MVSVDLFITFSVTQQNAPRVTLISYKPCRSVTPLCFLIFLRQKLSFMALRHIFKDISYLFSVSDMTELLKFHHLFQGLLVAILYCFINKEVRWMHSHVEQHLNLISTIAAVPSSPFIAKINETFLIISVLIANPYRSFHIFKSFFFVPLHYFAIY